MKRPMLFDLKQRCGVHKYNMWVQGCAKNATKMMYEYGGCMKSYNTYMVVKILDVLFFYEDMNCYTRTTRRHIQNAYGMSFQQVREYMQQHPERVFTL